ncbi:hypothetical protein WJX74_003372 [Apatococcus lobatus]|uniref:Uncharacterized protein n=2 Tax=Apatococcus TaxID=904362 RepID=A0AAW1SRX6_9CHLO
MPPRPEHAPQSHISRSSVSGLVFAFASCLACVYVAGRLWQTSRELHYVQRELDLASSRRMGAGGFPYMDSSFSGDSPGQEKILYYNIRQGAAPAKDLKGPKLADAPPDSAAHDDRLLGQIDGVESGQISGWACLRGSRNAAPLQVMVYVDGFLVGEVAAKGDTPHHIIHRLCDLDMNLENEMEQPTPQQGVGFALKLPELRSGRHEIRAFVKAVDGSGKQELNQSPLPFIESLMEPGMDVALQRKDAIIRVRNAQISALWDELHTRQPWKNALAGELPIAFADSGKQTNQTKRLAVMGINTGLGARVRRDNLRRTWVPTGAAMKKLEEEKGIVIRFVVGYSEQKDDPDEAKLLDEMKAYGDIWRIDMVDTYADLALKTLKMFSILPARVDADFYFKVDDDVAMNVGAMAEYLQSKRTQGNLYLGCMKSGQVLTDRRYKWFEPEYWRFGEASSTEGSINYPRHASGQIYGLSAPVAKYIGRNAPILHRFANEDVTLGAWLLGLEVEHLDERRLCCDSPERCQAQTSEANTCLSYYEHQCAGICSSEQRLEPIWQACLKDPLNRMGQQFAAAVVTVAADQQIVRR